MLKDLSHDHKNNNFLTSSSYLPEGTLEERRKKGAVYTPPILANYITDKVLKIFISDIKKKQLKIDLNKLKVLDPACGKGELLVSFWNSFHNLFFNQKLQSNSIEGSLTTSILCGIDTDKNAIKETSKRLSSIKTKKNTKNYLINTNSLSPYSYNDIASGWRRIKNEFIAPDGFDFIIANPPWGADVDLAHNPLLNETYSLLKGQYDSCELFVESAIFNLKDNGYFAFILPDSLFSHERKSLRELLLKKMKIRFIGRLGEKFFGGINRACAVIICQKTSPGKSNNIECLRLLPAIRKKILSNSMSMFEAEKELSHSVPQERFLNNKNFVFDIDLQLDEESTLNKIKNCNSNLGAYLFSSRGVELSKNGKISQCNNCSKWLQSPTKSNATCPHCKSSIVISSLKSSCIISKEKRKGHYPIVVGEHIQRYKITNNYWISITKEGINYKEMFLYNGPKLLVRKTGVGISATIDYGNSLTNQVVFIFKVKDIFEEKIPLEFFLGLVCSRAIYYYTVKNYGETEWRSHPYVTQKQILNLPIPDLNDLLTSHWDSVYTISKIVKDYANSNTGIPENFDAKIEEQIAKLYNLDRNDYDIIFNTLNNIESLKPVRELLNINVDTIFNI